MFQWLLKKQQQTVKTLNPSTQSIVAYQSHRLGGAAFKQDKGNYQSTAPQQLAFLRYGGRNRSVLFGLGGYTQIHPNLIAS